MQGNAKLVSDKGNRKTENIKGQEGKKKMEKSTREEAKEQTEKAKGNVHGLDKVRRSEPKG